MKLSEQLRDASAKATDAELVELAAKTLNDTYDVSQRGEITNLDDCATAVIAAIAPAIRAQGAEAYERGPTPEQVREACAKVAGYQQPFGPRDDFNRGILRGREGAERAIRALDLSKIGGE